MRIITIAHTHHTLDFHIISLLYTGLQYDTLVIDIVAIAHTYAIHDYDIIPLSHT